MAELGKGFLPSLLLNEDVAEVNDAFLMPGCFSRTYLLCPRTWSLCLLYCCAPALASCLGRQCQGVFLSCLLGRPADTSRTKPWYSPWIRQCKDLALKQRAFWLLEHQYCCCEPACGAGCQMGTRAGMIDEPPL